MGVCVAVAIMILDSDLEDDGSTRRQSRLGHVLVPFFAPVVTSTRLSPPTRCRRTTIKMIFTSSHPTPHLSESHGRI